MNLLTHRRGSVALMAGMMGTVMAMALAMAIEVTSWSVTNVDLQRIADVAAWAGAAQYVATKSAQTATQTAADVAEMNGVSYTTARAWNAVTLTTSDNLITAQVVAGVKNAADKAIKVTVKQSINKTISNIFPSTRKSVMVPATAIAEIVSVAEGPQPCVLALQAGGVTITDVELTGSANLTVTGCSVVSNAGISLCGPYPYNSCSDATITAGGTYAAGAITIPSWHPSAITGGSYPTSGVITDPYAGNAALQNALSSLASGNTPGPVIQDPKVGGSTTTTLSPGTYTGLTVGNSGKVTLSPGTYYVQGNVNFSGAATITGNNVTIISLGTFTDTASAAVSLTAPTTASGDGIPGVLFASQSAGQSQFSGAVAFYLNGVIYFPNGNLSLSGSVDVNNNATACGEMIAGTITITGAANLSPTGCTPYGTTKFGSFSILSPVLVE